MFNQDTLTQRAAIRKEFNFASLGDDKSRLKFSIGVLPQQKKHINHIKLQSLNIKTEPSESCLTPLTNSQSFLSPHRHLINKKSIIKSDENNEQITDKVKQFLIETFKNKSPQEMQKILKAQNYQHKQEIQEKNQELEEIKEKYEQLLQNQLKMSENEFKIENEKLIQKMQFIHQVKSHLEELYIQSQINLDSFNIKELTRDQEKLYYELENEWKVFKLENRKELNDLKKQNELTKSNVLLQY